MKAIEVTLLFWVLFVFGCSDSAPVEIEKLLNENLKFCEAEDFEGYLSTMHPEAINEVLKNEMLSLWHTYDLSYSIESIELVSMTENKTIVRVIQTTTKKRGPSFADNRGTFIHELRKHDNAWKFFSTGVEKFETL